MEFKKKFLFGANPDCPWAEKMVLNPALIGDPEDADTIHMLFRATGPGAEGQIPGKPLPYPIALGYAVSRDGGESWECDWSRPALAPRLKRTLAECMIRDGFGRRTFDYANGAIEDPRLFYFEGQLHLSVACRIFAPGPYWDHDDPVQCMPDEVFEMRDELGRAVLENTTVTLLYKVDLAALRRRDYDHAFALVAPLHQPDRSDDRDVFLFPRRLSIRGRERIVALHRPKEPWRYEVGKDLSKPSIFLSAADSPADFATGENVETVVFAQPEFEWESNRIGASFAPMEIEPGLWLIPYHGKQDDEVGYTQSFMLARENEFGFPQIVARPKGRMLFASEEWELGGDYATPCLFTCSGVVRNGQLMMGYGAADRKVGLVTVDCDALVAELKK